MHGWRPGLPGRVHHGLPQQKVRHKTGPLPCAWQRGPSVKGARKVLGLGLQRLEVLLDLLASGLAGELGPHLQLAAEGDGGHAHGRDWGCPSSAPERLQLDEPLYVLPPP